MAEEMAERVSELTRAHNACVRKLQQQIHDLQREMAEMAREVQGLRELITGRPSARKAA